MTHLTVKQLREICSQHRYILARFDSGYQMGINCRIKPIAERLRPFPDDHETEFVSVTPCSFNEYISKKHPFGEIKKEQP